MQHDDRFTVNRLAESEAYRGKTLTMTSGFPFFLLSATLL